MPSRAVDLMALSRRLRTLDAPVADEIARKLDRKRWTKTAGRELDRAATALARLVETPGEAALPGLDHPDFREEAIVLRTGRPVFDVRDGAAVLESALDAEVWQRRLAEPAVAARLARAITAVGRIEVDNHPLAIDYVGTGWLIEPGVIVTNRHVAAEFAERQGDGFRFRRGFDRAHPVGARIDFLEEIDNPAALELAITEILYLAPAHAPDVALLRLAPSTGAALETPPIPLARGRLDATAPVAVIGYPAEDRANPDRRLMDQLFGGVYEKKRLAPGLVLDEEAGILHHDCTTLGGNSGSVVLDLSTGEAAGLHFAGIFLRANLAVPATVVREAMQQRRSGPIGALTSGHATAVGLPTAAIEVQGKAGSAMGATMLEVTIPLEITLRIGQPAVTGAAVAPAAKAPVGERALAAAVEAARRQLASRLDVVAVKPGWRFRDGWITDERAVIVAVRQKLPLADVEASGLTALPRSIEGVPVDVTFATPDDLFPEELSVDPESPFGRWVANYAPRDDLPLCRVQAPMRVVLHAGPDAGWPELERFLALTEDRLVVGMYDFTAPHVIDAVEAAVGPEDRSMVLVIQAGESLGGGTKKDDVPDAETVGRLGHRLGQRFAFTWAAVRGPQRIFDSSYHIKLAIRDGRAFWLSSGSWQSSNQPPIDPLNGPDTRPAAINRYNREWHVVLEHPGLAERFEAHLRRDLEDARAIPELPFVAEPELWVPAEFFQPTVRELAVPPRYRPPLVVERSVTVEPLLTPDNYQERVLALIQGAERRIWFQNQSLRPLATNHPRFAALLEALRDKQRAGLDVRIVFRRFPSLRDDLTRLKDFGFATDQSLMRAQTNCHTKGMIVDSRAVLVGSHNWSNAGTLFNRDASLIFHDLEIAAYFEDLFRFDWERAGPSPVTETIPAIAVVDADETPRASAVRVPLSELRGY